MDVEITMMASIDVDKGRLWMKWRNMEHALNVKEVISDPHEMPVDVLKSVVIQGKYKLEG